MPLVKDKEQDYACDSNPWDPKLHRPVHQMTPRALLSVCRWCSHEIFRAHARSTWWRRRSHMESAPEVFPKEADLGEGPEA